MARSILRTRLLPIAAVTAVLAASFTAPQPFASAAPGDDLDVQFGGSLVGNTAYTTIEGEQMSGVLRRVVGTEVQTPGEGVTLAGSNQGLRFDASALALGDSSGLIDESFAVEAVFTPTLANYTNQTTLISAAGNFSVRYENGQFSYGFDTNADGNWVSHRQFVPNPAINVEHAVSVHYVVEEDGSVTVAAMLDGEVLPPVQADASARINGSLQSAFGFGHDIHPQAFARGFTGKLSAIRVTGTDGVNPQLPVPTAASHHQPVPRLVGR